MGLRGRIGQSSDENKRKGNPRKRNLSKEETKVEVDDDDLFLIEMQDYLSPEAEEVWNQIVPKLEKLGLLMATDSFALSDYCVEQGHAIKWERFIKENGASVTHRNRTKSLREEFKWAADARKRAAELRKSLFLTPEKRKAGKIDAKKKKKLDAAAQKKAHVLGQS